jgi:hypothetical protein
MKKVIPAGTNGDSISETSFKLSGVSGENTKYM